MKFSIDALKPLDFQETINQTNNKVCAIFIVPSFENFKGYITSQITLTSPSIICSLSDLLRATDWGGLEQVPGLNTYWTLYSHSAGCWAGLHDHIWAFFSSFLMYIVCTSESEWCHVQEIQEIFIICEADP